LLSRHATASGAEVREGWEVTRAIFEHDRAVGVEARGEDGVTHSVYARVVVDASGRDAIIARSLGHVERIPGLDRTALFTQVRGGWRDAGERAGDIQIAVCGDDAERSWFWLIPFADGRTSVGAVVSPAWIKARRDTGGPADLFAEALRQAPLVARMLEGSESLFAPRATPDYSFGVTAMRGEGWIALGDAAGFIDPLFSTGVHLAMVGALGAADAIDTALRDDDRGPQRFEAWERDLRAGSALFLAAVQAFYSGDLIEVLFANPQRPFLRRAITSLLAGDVFRDSRWVRELRARWGSWS
ncbi:MAG: NAD(P)/FAD-dependent oxidoreductase, partial [Polyangiaceae bacterium]